MALKSMLTSQEDFTGEKNKTMNTEALWKFNGEDSDFISDEKIEAGPRASSEPTGFPRQEIDGTPEKDVVYKQSMVTGNSDIRLAGARIYKQLPSETGQALFNDQALDLSTGLAFVPSGVTGQGNNRSVNIWVKFDARDLAGGWSVIASQRTTEDRGYQFATYGNQVNIRAYAENQARLIEFDSNIAFNTTDWYLISLNHSATQWQVRIDGTSQDAGTLTAPIATNSIDWELGAKTGIDRFYGKIGGMFITNTRWMTEINDYHAHALETVKLLPIGITLKTTGKWEETNYDIRYYEGKAIYTNTPGSAVEYGFSGGGLIWRTRTGPAMGIAKIYIDDVFIEDVDLYSATDKYQQIVFETDSLSRDSHKVSIRYSGTKNASSSNTYIYHGSIAVNPGGNIVKDSSGLGNDLSLSNWGKSMGTNGFYPGKLGNHLVINYTDPSVEQMSLVLTNRGNLWTGLGKRIAIGGWVEPTYYSVTRSLIPIISTQGGSAKPIFDITLNMGKVEVTLFDENGNQIHSTIEDAMPAMDTSKWYFIGVEIDISGRRLQVVVIEQGTNKVHMGPSRAYSGILNASSTADLVFANIGDQWYSGSLDDWFIEKDSDLRIEDIRDSIIKSSYANAGDTRTSVDGITISGSVILGKSGSNYVSSGVLESGVMDLGSGGLQGNGSVIVVGEYESGSTAIHSISTRTRASLDTGAWSAWEPIIGGGGIVSPNNRYIQVKLTMTTSVLTKTPKIQEIQIHEKIEAPYQRLGYARPVILSQDNVREAVLENAYDIVVTEEVNGAQFVNFKIPYHDGKRVTIDNEKKVQFTEDIYRIRTVTDEKDSSNNTVTSVYAEANFYDLAFSDPIAPTSYEEETPERPMQYALAGTGWTIGEITVTSKRTWEADERNALLFLRKIQELWGGDLVFNNGERTVSLLKKSGSDDGVVFAYRKNMQSIQKVVDTKELITKLFVVGKDDLTIRDANRGREYLSDYTHTKEVRSLRIENNSFTNPYQLKEWGEERLEELSQPRVSYVIGVMDLSTLSGWEHESFNLGDEVVVDDQEMGIQIKTRIIRRQYNTQEPWKTVIELSTKLRELGDEMARWAQSSEALEDSNYVEKQDISDLMVFNHLLNSRADDGFAYWQNSGFTIDNESGFSGPASFKVEGQLGANKSMLQTIRPANRNHYTVSAKMSTKNLEKGPNGKVGLEVKVFYEDGTDETKFIEL